MHTSPKKELASSSPSFSPENFPYARFPQSAQGYATLLSKAQRDLALRPLRVMLAVRASVAAYKAFDLLRLLIKEGASVRVMLSKSVSTWLSPDLFLALGAEAVMVDFSEDMQDGEMRHIDWAKWCTVLAVVPASAHSLFEMAHGSASDPALAALLSTPANVLIAPAMNQRMYNHPATAQNIRMLRSYGYVVYPTETGDLACGEHGKGRLADIAWLLKEILLLHALPKIDGRMFSLGDSSINDNDPIQSESFQTSTQQGKHGKKICVGITLGSTREFIDPVRFVGNQSSGKMGYAMARAFSRLGAEVVCFSGVTSIAPPPDVQVIQCLSAESMHEAVMARMDDFDIFIGAAAVSDFTIPNQSEKIKKSTNPDGLSLLLTPTKDILQEVAQHKARPKPLHVIGFAAETDPQNWINYGVEKKKHKNLDALVANYVSLEEGFAAEHIMSAFIKNQDRPQESCEDNPKVFFGDKMLLTHYVALYTLKSQ